MKKVEGFLQFVVYGKVIREISVNALREINGGLFVRCLIKNKDLFNYFKKSENVYFHYDEFYFAWVSVLPKKGGWREYLFCGCN